jgi:hypothetical protein
MKPSTSVCDEKEKGNKEDVQVLSIETAIYKLSFNEMSQTDSEKEDMQDIGSKLLSRPT